MPNDYDRVFVSYASKDVEKALALAESLSRFGIHVWIDKRDLSPGSWRTQIERAIARSRFFLICISNAALQNVGDAPGFQDEELQQAYSIARMQPTSSFTIIPVRFEQCGRGDHRTATYQQYDLFPDWDAGVRRLALTLRNLSSTTKEKQTPEDPMFAARNFAYALYYAGEHQQAIAAWQEIATNSAETSETWFRIGLNWEALGDSGKAAEAYASSIRLDPSNAAALNNVGVLLLRENKNEEATAYFDRALERDPQYALALYNKAFADLALGKPEDAMKCIRQIAQIDPNDIARYKDAWGDFFKLLPVFRFGYPPDRLANDPHRADAELERLRVSLIDDISGRGRRGGGFTPMTPIHS